MRKPQVSPGLYRVITAFSLGALVLIVVTGGAVRLTGSGLGCSDWPGCTATDLVPALGFHEWMEFGNRLVTGVVSVLVIVAVLTAVLRSPRRRDLTWLSVGLVVGVIAQIILGAVVVATDLNPVLVQGHFIVSGLLVLDAVVLHHRAGIADLPPDADGVVHPEPVAPIAPPDVRLCARIVVALTALAIVLGTVVTGAGPHSGQNAVDGKVQFVDRLDIAVRDAARLHSAVVWLLLGAVVFTVWRLRQAAVPTRVVHRAELVLTVVLLQGLLGYVQYFTRVPPLLVGLHILGATLLWVVVLQFLLGLSEPVADPRQSSHDLGQRDESGDHPGLDAAGGAGADLVPDR